MHHLVLNLIAQTAEVDGKSVEHGSLHFVGRKVADQRALGCDERFTKVRSI